MQFCGVLRGDAYCVLPFFSLGLMCVCFSVLFSTVITLLGGERAGLYASRVFVRIIFCLFFSSSWCYGMAAGFDCGTPWIFA